MRNPQHRWMHRLFTMVAMSCLSLGAFCLEAKEGLVKIVANEANGRVSLYRLVDIAKNKYEPLIFDTDPRTSFVTLSIDGRTFKLGDSSDYRVICSRIDTGVRIEFKSSFCSVKLSYEFIKSDGAALADGVHVSVEMENLSDRDTQLGVRYLVDTYLAEKSGIHFTSDKRARINEETAILPSNTDTWIATPGEKASFMVQLSGPGIDRPDRVMLANWKRISDASWSFDANAQRNFTLVPYSINDSAMALYWDPTLVARGGSRRVAFVMGSFNEKGYPAATAATQTDQIFAATVLGQAAPDTATAIAGDLVAVRDLISRIDKAIAQGGNISQDEIAAWYKILDRLEERKKGY